MNHITAVTFGATIRGPFLHAACFAAGEKRELAPWSPSQPTCSEKRMGKNQGNVFPVSYSLHQKEEQARNYIKIEIANN